MTTEEKNLLLKDLCARLPYKVKVQFRIPNYQIEGFDINIGEAFAISLDKGLIDLHCKGIDYNVNINNIKPYLRPLSSMTDEEKEELKQEFCMDVREEDNGRHTEEYGYVTVYHNFNNETWSIPYEAIDWLNEHHFDYRGLIDKCLALELY